MIRMFSMTANWAPWLVRLATPKFRNPVIVPFITRSPFVVTTAATPVAASPGGLLLMGEAAQVDGHVSAVTTMPLLSDGTLRLLTSFTASGKPMGPMVAY